MHTGPVPGEFTGDEPELLECPKCKQRSVVVRNWESSCGGYEDEKHECRAPGCGYSRWFEGIDS